MKCEYCERKFHDNPEGLAEKTFHELTHDPNQVNGLDPEIYTTADTVPRNIKGGK